MYFIHRQKLTCLKNWGRTQDVPSAEASRTSSGRRVLARVGRKPPAPLLPTPSPPWLRVMSATVPPLYTNVGGNEQSPRHYHHRRAILNDNTAQCVHMDAAVSQNHASTASMKSDSSKTGTTHSAPISTTGAELQVILVVAQAARNGHPDLAAFYTYTRIRKTPYVN